MRNEMAEVEACCKQIMTDTRALLAWEWDEYIGAVLAKFDLKHANYIDRILSSCFASKWTAADVAKAPASVRRIADALGGLRETQRLYVTSAADKITAFGAWWPWGDEQTISIRIGLVLKKIDDLSAARLHDEFVAWFTGEV